ncbi:MAG: hypothetical protein WD295_06740 [Bacteroidota bacterium]
MIAIRWNWGMMGLALWAVSCTPGTDPDDTVEQTYRHIRAAWSPDGSTVAFTAAIESVLGIYAVDSSGANLRLLRAGDGIGLSWSPDSRRIVFSEAGALYTMLADGDSVVQLTVGPSHFRPSWSRDGTKIAFMRSVQGATESGLLVYDVGTSSSSFVYEYGNFPSWHPNGEEIVVLDALPIPGSAGLEYRFEAIHTDTKVHRNLWAFATTAECGFASMSPSGNEIIFSVVRPREYTQIWKADLQSLQLIRLTEDGEGGDFSAWNGDGTRIVYTRTVTGDGGLWIMNADGTNKRRLTTP